MTPPQPLRRLFRAPLWWLLAAGVSVLAWPFAARSQTEPLPGDYRIVDGKLDRGSYAGWRVFHTVCFSCHGVGAVGTDLAPNLVERVQQLTPRQFAIKVLTSYRLVSPPGGAHSDDAQALRDAMLEDILRRQRGGGASIRMPAWEVNPDVEPHVLDLFAYLSARADGLGPGKPEPWEARRKR